MNYLFSKLPGTEFKFYIPLLILAGLLIVGGLIFGSIYKKKKKEDFAFKRIFKKLSKTAILMGILFGFLLLVRYEGIPYFSMRIWLYLSLLLLVFFIYRYFKKWRVDYPREKENVEYRRAASKSQKKEVPKYTTHKKRK